LGFILSWKFYFGTKSPSPDGAEILFIAFPDFLLVKKLKSNKKIAAIAGNSF